MNITQILSNFFKNKKLATKQLNIDDLLPKRFVTTRHKPKYVLAVDNPHYLVKSPYLDSFIINKWELLNKPEKPSKKGSVKIVLDDSISPDGCKEVMKWIQQCLEYKPNSTPNHINLYIRELDQIGQCVNITVLKNCFLTEANFNDLTQESSADANEIEFIISFENSG